MIAIGAVGMLVILHDRVSDSADYTAIVEAGFLLPPSISQITECLLVTPVVFANSRVSTQHDSWLPWRHISYTSVSVLISEG